MKKHEILIRFDSPNNFSTVDMCHEIDYLLRYDFINCLAGVINIQVDDTRRIKAGKKSWRTRRQRNKKFMRGIK